MTLLTQKNNKNSELNEDSINKIEYSGLYDNVPSISGTINNNLNHYLFSKKIDSYVNLIKNFSNISNQSLEFLEEKPNQISIDNAIEVLRILGNMSIVPNKVSSSPDGGIIFELLINKDYYLFELFNTDEYVFFKKDQDDKRFAFDLSFEELKKKIKNEFYGNELLF